MRSGIGVDRVFLAISNEMLSMQFIKSEENFFIFSETVYKKLLLVQIWGDGGKSFTSVGSIFALCSYYDGNKST